MLWACPGMRIFNLRGNANQKFANSHKNLICKKLMIETSHHSLFQSTPHIVPIK